MWSKVSAKTGNFWQAPKKGILAFLLVLVEKICWIIVLCCRANEQAISYSLWLRMMADNGHEFQVFL